MKPTSCRLLAIAAASGICWVSSAQNLIVNGSFETPVSKEWNTILSTNSLWPWQTTADSFEVWTNIDLFPSADGTQNLEILSTTSKATVWQTISTTPGADYAFSFFHTARNGVDSLLTVAINSTTVATFFENGADLTRADWQRFRTNFTAVDGSTTISFSDEASYNGGTHIDGVAVERLPLSVQIRVSDVELSWETVTNKAYQVQFRSAATTNVWIDLGTVAWGSGATMRLKDAIPSSEPQRIYRIITVP